MQLQWCSDTPESSDVQNLAIEEAWSETWKWSFGCLKSRLWIKVGRNNPSTSLGFPSINQQALILSINQNQQVCHETCVRIWQVLAAQLTRSYLHLANISYGAGKGQIQKFCPILSLLAFCACWDAEPEDPQVLAKRKNYRWSPGLAKKKLKINFDQKLDRSVLACTNVPLYLDVHLKIVCVFLPANLPIWHKAYCTHHCQM